VGVDIDPAGGHQQPVGADLALAWPGLAADLRQSAAVDRDIARQCVRARAVDYAAAANDDVVHLSAPPMSGKA
jgi:hypothetical protein